MFLVGAVCLGGALLFAGAGVTPSAIRVQGNTVCPTAVEVQTALVGMVPSTGETTAPDVVALTSDGTSDRTSDRTSDGTSDDRTSVSVRLESATGERIAERRLPGGKSCAERARAAAVIVAAWEVHLHGGTQPSLPSFQGAHAATPAVALVATPPRQRGTSKTTTVPTTVPTSVPTSVSALVGSPSSSGAVALAVAPPPSITLPAPLQLELGGEVLAAVVASDVARAALVELRVARPGSVFAAAVSGLGIDAHTRPVGSGQGRWRRFGGIFDLRSVARWRPVELELRLGLVLTAVAIAGQAFPVTQGATLFDPGGVAGLRARFRVGRLVAWTDATAAFWPRAHNLYVTGDTTSADLPSVELLLGVGLSFLVRR